MHIEFENNAPVVKDLPPGNDILFFAKIDKHRGYCLIFGPLDKCLPGEGHGMTELWDAKVAFGKEKQDLEIHEVKHGHKYEDGGGYIETEHRGGIFFRQRGDEKPSTYEGSIIEEVYIAL